MKEDHIKNGQLKPDYNVQIITENQFITNLPLHRRAGDTATIPHMEQFKRLYYKQSSAIVAYSDYDREQSYQHLDD